MHDKIPSSIVPTFLLMMSTHVPAHLDSYVVVLKRRLAKYADLPDYKIYELYLYSVVSNKRVVVISMTLGIFPIF